MADRERAVAKYRSEWARAFYDRANARPRDTSWQKGFERFFELRRKSIAQLELKFGDTVLDVGSGSGLSFSELERWIGSEGRIIGIEQSQEQLAAARALAESQGWRNIVLIDSPVEEAEIPGRGRRRAILVYSRYHANSAGIVKRPRTSEDGRADCRYRCEMGAVLATA